MTGLLSWIMSSLEAGLECHYCNLYAELDVFPFGKVGFEKNRFWEKWLWENYFGKTVLQSVQTTRWDSRKGSAKSVNKGFEVYRMTLIELEEDND